MAMTEIAEQFALRWNNFSHNLSSGFLSHLNNKDLVDVTIAVDGQLLQAHKLVLSVCSPYFQDIFKINPCKHPVVILKDIGFAEVESLLKFMYQGEVNVKQEELASFLKVAEALKVKGLTLDHNTINPIKPERSQKKRSQNSTVHSNSKRSRSSLNVNTKESTSLVTLSPKIESQDVDNDNTIKTSTNDSNKHDTSSKDITINLTNDDELDDTNDISEIRAASRNSSPEPVTYRLSARGRPQLVHEGYVYNLTSRSEVLNRSHYRCAEQHRGCRGKCAVIAERFMPTGVHEHNHEPGYQSEYDYRKKKGPDVEEQL
ncbi:hypothetical protein HCN44_004381 [Aphidius gifuensis]|uniref:BTB domain-containing protein n=1 Tax=Aphidius gifuensis TaxID=684658 RepID=A0A835CTC6_APHGI|nr:hypothetical protein HCN44_004381 [Aphidius gifuensis]